MNHKRLAAIAIIVLLGLLGILAARPGLAARSSDQPGRIPAMRAQPADLAGRRAAHPAPPHLGLGALEAWARALLRAPRAGPTPASPFSLDTAITLPGVVGSSVAWGDYDNDGRLDFLLTGCTDIACSGPPISRLYHNDGGGRFSPAPGLSLPGVFEGSVAWGDYDNDGRLDLLLTGCTDFNCRGRISQLYHNDGGGTFSLDTAISLPGVYGSSVAWGDYDNDGRLDFLFTGVTGSGYISQLYHNDGGGTFSLAPGLSLPGEYWGSVAWGDYDNDGRLDFLLTGCYDSDCYGPFSQLYHNDGGGTFSLAPGLSLPGVVGSSMAWGDYDNDGRLDLLLTGCTDRFCGGCISQLYHNDGGGTFSLDTAISPPEVGPSSVAWGDYDNDGRLDFLLTGYDCWGNQISQLYHNDGGGRFSVAPGLSLPGVSPSSVAWGDYNNDGRLDFLLIGNTGSGLISQLYHNDGAIANTPPTAPGGLTVTAVTTRTAALQWTAAADSQTTQTLGLNYNLRVGTRPGASDVVNPAANTALLTETTGLRRLPALGPARPNLTTTLVLTPTTTYYWSVQAIDTAFAGGPFAPEASFTTPCWATFSDVYPTDYFYTPVQYLYCHGVLSGYSDGSFRPYTNTTRAQMVKIVVLGFAKPLVTPAGGAHTFADVPPAHPFFAVVETAAADTIVSGYTCGGPNEPCDTGNRPYFRPGANVTRGQLAKIVVSAAAWPLWNPPLGTFADVLPGSAFYGFVETASCNEVISGYACGTVPSEPCDGQYRPYYRPANSATRGQIAKIADLALTGSLPCVGPARSPTPVPSAPTTTVTPTLLPPTATATPPPTPPAVTATATP